MRRKRQMYIYMHDIYCEAEMIKELIEENCDKNIDYKILN